MRRRLALIVCLPLTRCLLLCLVLCAASCTDAGHPEAPARVAVPVTTRTRPAYTVTDLGTLTGYNISAADGINDTGQVVGVCVRRKDPKIIGSDPTRAFEWQGGHLRALGALPRRRDSSAACINNEGLVVGASFTGDPDGGRAVLWRHGRAVDLGSLPGYPYSAAAGLNDAGQVVGYASTGKADRYYELVYRAFLWQRGGMRALPALGGTYSYAYAINDLGLIVGKADLPPDVSRLPSGDVSQPGLTRAALWQHQKVRDMGALTGDGNSLASGINSAGEAAGFSRTVTTFHAALWRGGAVTRLGTPHEDDVSLATAINNRGQVVGCWHDTALFAPERACLWQNGRLLTLDDAIPACSGWRLEAAVAINNHGQIVGSGKHHGVERAFLLTPLAERTPPRD